MVYYTYLNYYSCANIYTSIGNTVSTHVIPRIFVLVYIDVMIYFVMFHHLIMVDLLKHKCVVVLEN